MVNSWQSCFLDCSYPSTLYCVHSFSLGCVCCVCCKLFCDFKLMMHMSLCTWHSSYDLNKLCRIQLQSNMLLVWNLYLFWFLKEFLKGLLQNFEKKIHHISTLLMFSFIKMFHKIMLSLLLEGVTIQNIKWCPLSPKMHGGKKLFSRLTRSCIVHVYIKTTLSRFHNHWLT